MVQRHRDSLCELQVPWVGLVIPALPLAVLCHDPYITHRNLPSPMPMVHSWVVLLVLGRTNWTGQLGEDNMDL